MLGFLLKGMKPTSTNLPREGEKIKKAGKIQQSSHVKGAEKGRPVQNAQWSTCPDREGKKRVRSELALGPFPRRCSAYKKRTLTPMLTGRARSNHTRSGKRVYRTLPTLKALLNLGSKPCKLDEWKARHSSKEKTPLVRGGKDPRKRFFGKTG